MRIEHVQVTAVGETSPVHALMAVLDDETGGYDTDTVTVCGRLKADGGLRLPEPPFDPFANTPAEQRCATCEYMLGQQRAGLPQGITRFQ